MSRRPDVPCNRCGELMWRGSTSLPEGKARCRTCRRIEPQRGTKATGKRPLMMCPQCWQVFTPSRQSQKVCSLACYGKSKQIRADDDPHQRRSDREKNAPGLSKNARARLLARWKRQSKACAYCDAPAVTVDHVVPLIRGGTNHEGNLASACKSCNSRKGGLTVIEWRTGKRLPRMGRALAWQNRVRVVKVKPEPVTHACPICTTQTTLRLYCSTACGAEGNNRHTRDAYRVRVGLPVDFGPTKAWSAQDLAV